MRSGLLMTPRPVPGRLVPALGAVLVLGLALVVFLVAGWSVAGWAIGAVLWAGTWGLGLLLRHLRSPMGNLASSGVLAFELFFKSVAVLVVVVALAASDASLAVAALLVFALAYTLELGLALASYFGGSR